jgi:hypothetical protein
MSSDSRQEAETLERELLARLRASAADLRSLLAANSDMWGYEDPVYRFYHQSFKVYAVQRQTERIVRALRELAPGRPLNDWFEAIVRRGTGRRFEDDHNARWTEETRPMLEAYFHARFFLEMAVRYSELDSLPRPLPSGYAALLYLWGLR